MVCARSVSVLIAAEKEAEVIVLDFSLKKVRGMDSDIGFYLWDVGREALCALAPVLCAPEEEGGAATRTPKQEGGTLLCRKLGHARCMAVCRMRLFVWSLIGSLLGTVRSCMHGHRSPAVACAICW